MPRTIRPQSFEEQIAGNRLEPVYLLAGPDEDLKATLVSRLIDAVDPDVRPFNVDKIFPADHRDEVRRQFWDVMELARTLPMMAPRRLVVIAQAEKLMAIFRASDEEAPEPTAPVPAGRRGRRPAQRQAGEAELEALEQYLSNPSPHAVIVFVAGEKLNRSLKAVRLLEKSAIVVEFGAGDAGAWIRAEAASEGVRIDAAAARLLASLAGRDMTRLRAEFERAVLFASEDGIVTEAAVRETAGALTTRDPWAMTNAIERGAAGEALRELALKLDAGEYPPMILGQIRWYVTSRLPARHVPRAVEAIFRTDQALKRSGGDPRVLLERLVVELCG